MDWERVNRDMYVFSYPDGWKGVVQRTKSRWVAYIEKNDHVKDSSGSLATIGQAFEWCHSEFRSQQVNVYTSVSDRRSAVCKICKASMGVTQRLHHFITYHPSIIAYKPRGYLDTTKQHQAPLILHSKRGRRVQGNTLCQVCGRALAQWKYAKSTQGTVYLCNRCKAQVLDFSFGRIDLADIAESGAFETNRRRH